MERITVFPETVATIGPVRITDTVVNTWVVMAAIILAVFVATRRLAVRPTRVQGLLESIYAAIEKTVREIVPVKSRLVVAVLGTLWALAGRINLSVGALKTAEAQLQDARQIYVRSQDPDVSAVAYIDLDLAVLRHLDGRWEESLATASAAAARLESADRHEDRPYKWDNAPIAFFGIFRPCQPNPFDQAFQHLGFICRIADEINAVA